MTALGKFNTRLYIIQDYNNKNRCWQVESEIPRRVKRTKQQLSAAKMRPQDQYWVSDGRIELVNKDINQFKIQDIYMGIVQYRYETWTIEETEKEGYYRSLKCRATGKCTLNGWIELQMRKLLIELERTL